MHVTCMYAYNYTVCVYVYMYIERDINRYIYIYVEREIDVFRWMYLNPKGVHHGGLPHGGSLLLPGEESIQEMKGLYIQFIYIYIYIHTHIYTHAHT